VTPKELFAVGVRLVGLWFVMATIPELFALSYLGIAPAVAGLILITRADLIAQFCYPNELRNDALRDLRDKVPKDFRDS
jgi:hypothetical protein